MVQKKAMDRAVTTFHKGCRETIDEQSFDAFFALESAIEELDVCVWVIGEEVEDFLVQTFVQVIAVFVMEFADFGLCFQLLDFGLESLDRFEEVFCL